MRAREGDLIETHDANIFDVKGLVHPPRRIIAFIRFTPDLGGERKRGALTYRKVYPLHERYALLAKKLPRYLVYDPVFGEPLCEVPTGEVKRLYKPIDYLQKLRKNTQLDQTEKSALQFAGFLKKHAKIPWSKVGISGSLLVGLQTPNSDIDIVVYGSNNCRKVFDALCSLVNSENGSVRSYGSQELENLFDFRSKDTATRFEDFAATESRKVLQGKFEGQDYYIRCVKDWNETNEQYGAVYYQPIGYAKIRAKVTDDSQSIFTPCCYKTERVKTIEGPQTAGLVEEIVSFRGRFCEQARNGETVIAQGKVEQVQVRGEREYCRLVLGNKISDHMILAQK